MRIALPAFIIFLVGLVLWLIDKPVSVPALPRREIWRAFLWVGLAFVLWSIHGMGTVILK